MQVLKFPLAAPQAKGDSNELALKIEHILLGLLSLTSEKLSKSPQCIAILIGLLDAMP